MSGEFNMDMDKYIKKIRKKRTDNIDYSEGKAKVAATVQDDQVNIYDLGEEEIIVETRKESGIKRFFVSIFNKDSVSK